MPGAPPSGSASDQTTTDSLITTGPKNPRGSKAVNADNLEIASKIKTQILRVREQIDHLAKADAQPDVPTLDSGAEGSAGTEPNPDKPDDNDRGEDDADDSPADNNEDEVDFFGIPLE